MKVWRFYRLSLIFEYYNRPILVPPIIIINHMFRIMRYLVFKKCNKYKMANEFKEKNDDNENDRLNLFEKMATERYLARSNLRERQKLNTRVSRTAKSSASGETAFLRQFVEDLSEQSSQQTLKISQLMEMLVKQKEGVHTRPELHNIDEATNDDHDV
ncbi:transient receptor potential cation channel subfamily M member 2-like [Gigantopelta aegis]|uniref:transient receptor potential cation channel subfamily M member 2-like n=1 Tax=Gigantopelta aegis TaxID=1735272 RepID=UPI001B887754|nr:transient receptor potential cation channel subfamily M member 2-like [Gigantopelta aegis]